MNTAVLVTGSVFAGIAALIHVYIWLLESVLWTSESTRRTFGVKSAADAEALRPMAYNQGFYNLFLALGRYNGSRGKATLTVSDTVLRERLGDLAK